MKTPDYCLSEKETAKILSVSCSKLRNDRYKRRGLPYVKDGRLVRYKWSQINKYLDERTINPSDESYR